MKIVRAEVINILPDNEDRNTHFRNQFFTAAALIAEKYTESFKILIRVRQAGAFTASTSMSIAASILRPLLG